MSHAIQAHAITIWDAGSCVYDMWDIVHFSRNFIIKYKDIEPMINPNMQIAIIKICGISIIAGIFLYVRILCKPCGRL